MKTNRKKTIKYDPSSDVLYIVIKKGREENFVEITPGVNVELNDGGEVIGIEILNASRTLKSILKPLYKKSTITS